MLLTPRFIDAMDFAREAHGSQVRKGTQVPYLSHPMAVASLVLEYGGGEDEAIAGLLHDVLEDEGAHLVEDIESRFGEYVLKIVVECSDALPVKGAQKPPWHERKLAYVEGIPHKTPGTQLVTACDKLHNLTAIVRDWHVVDDDLWTRFRSGAVGTRWYYENLGQVLLDVDVSPAGDIERRLGELGWRPRSSPMPGNLPPTAL